MLGDKLASVAREDSGRRVHAASLKLTSAHGLRLSLGFGAV